MSGTTLLNIETALGSLGRSSSTAPVILGPLTLTGVEVPSVLRIGGSQGLVVYRLVGGARVIQALGDDLDRLTLGGMFTGPSAEARAQLVANLRRAGSEIAFSVAGHAYRVRIASFGYDYAQKGAVIRYELVLEIQPTDTTTTSSIPSALSDLVGPDVASAITAVSNTISTVSAYAENAVGQAQTIVSQITPIATMVGAGGLLAHASDKLTLASGLAGAGTNFALVPNAAASMITGLQSAGTSLMSTIGAAGSNLTALSANAGAGTLVPDMGGLQAAAENAGVLAGSVGAGGAVNRALTNTALAAGLTPGVAVVHA